MKRFINSNI